MSILKGQKSKVWQSCTATLPTDKTKPLLVNFEALFTKMSKRDFQDFCKANNGVKGRPQLIDALPAHIHDWKMPGPEGVDVQFSDEAVEAAFDDVDYSDALVEGFMKVHIRRWDEITGKN